MLSDQQILDVARQVIADAGVGCFVTVSPDGLPYGRYMGATTGDNGQLNWVYSLSAHATHKIEHLQHNPNACWVFANENYEAVVTIHGQAHVEPTAEMPASAYNQLVEFAKPYAVNVLTDTHHHQFDAIVMQVDSLELLAPQRGLTAPHRVAIR